MSGEYIQSVYAEQQLQLKRMQVDLWNKELNRHKTPTEGDMLKLNKENKKVNFSIHFLNKIESIFTLLKNGS